MPWVGSTKGRELVHKGRAAKCYFKFFFLGRVSLWTTADPYLNSYAFTLLLFAGASHHWSYCRCAHRSTFKLSVALPSRKAHLFSPKGEPHFLHYTCRWDSATLCPLRCRFCILKHQRRPLCPCYLGGVHMWASKSPILGFRGGGTQYIREFWNLYFTT